LSRKHFISKLVLLCFFIVGPALFNFAYTNEVSKTPQVGSYLHFLLGSLAELENDSKIALDHFKSASLYDPTSSTLRLKQAEQLIHLGKYDDAKEIFKEVEKEEENNAFFYILKSRVYSQELDFENSSDSLDKAAEIYYKEKNQSKAREVVLTKVALLADYKKYKESIETLDKYIKNNPNDPIAYYFLGKVHSLFLNKTEAKEAFKKALEIRPGFVIAAKALGLQLELDGKLKEAVAVYQDALASNGGDIELIQKLVNLSLVLEKYELAIEYLNQYLSIKPEDTQNQMRAALIYFKLKNLDDAESIFLKLLGEDIENKDRVSYYLGALYQEKSSYQKSVNFYKKILPTSDYFIESRLELAKILSTDLRDHSGAVKSLTEAVALRPDKPELFLALAGHHENKKDFEKAVDILQQATKKFDGNEQILFMLGTFQDRAGLFEEGIATMKKVLEINPDNTHALNHIGYSYIERKIRLEEAEVYLKRAVQNSPSNGYVIDSLGWLYYQKAQYKKAIKYLERAAELAKDEPVIIEHLADAYQKVGKHKEALVLYKKIMRLSKDKDEKLLSEAENEERQMVANRVKEKLALLDADEPL
jgi:tetratricopeptide (TPR) repeat protein